MNTIIESADIGGTKAINWALQKSLSSPDGSIKIAAEEAIGSLILDKVKEKGLLRRAFPIPITTQASLASTTSSEPEVLVTKGFNTTAAYISNDEQVVKVPLEIEKFYRGFTKLATEEKTYTYTEMAALTMPIDKMLEINQVAEIQKLEDKLLIRNFEMALHVGGTADGNGIIGYNENYLDLTADPLNTGGILQAIVMAKKISVRNKLVPTLMLMHANTHTNSLFESDNIVGDSTVTRRFNEGIAAEGALWGMPFQTTMDDEIIPENTIYVVPDPKYFLSHSLLLRDLKLFTRIEPDRYVGWWASENISIAIGNVSGVVRIDFTPAKPKV